jgi:ketosteroid isomerase-like protein
MSEENVEVARQVLDAFHAGVERGDLGAFFDLEVVPNDYEVVLPEGAVGMKPVLRGREDWLEFFGTWTEDLEDWSQRVERLIDAGSDRVVALTHQSAVGRGSGVKVQLELGQVFEFEEGRLIRVTFYNGYAEALEAAGLSE